MSRTVNLFSSLVGWHQISRYFLDSCSVKILLTFNFLFITFFTTTAQDSNLIYTKKDIKEIEKIASFYNNYKILPLSESDIDLRNSRRSVVSSNSARKGT